MSILVSRRNLLHGAALGGLVANLPPGLRLSFAGTSSSANLVVFVLLRGGMDGLNLVAPSDDSDLIAARPADLRLLASGSGAALPLANGPTANDWRLHPSAPELKALYDSRHLAFVHAAGVPANSRSHFEMQGMIEHGVADPIVASNTATGWIGRYAASTGLAGSTFGVVSSSSIQPASMAGDPGAISMPDPRNFTLGSADRAKFIEAAYNPAQGFVAARGRTAIGAVNAFGSLNSSFKAPPAGTFANDAFGKGLSVIAELVKLGVGLRVAEVEYNSVWDTHVNQKPRFAGAAAVLSKGLGDFYNHLSAYAKSVMVVVISEFGRRVKSNADLGTDHGHGNVMLVLGGAVNGGRIYGQWLGLKPSVLDVGDGPVTTDYRSVLAAVISAARGDLSASVFPGVPPSKPLGLIG